MDCPLKLAANQIPDRLVFNETTYSDLDEQVDIQVAKLHSSGLEAGHILAVHLPTSLLFITLLFASIRIGAIFCPLNLRLPQEAVDIQIEFLKPKLFVSQTGIISLPSDKKELLPSSFLLFTSGSSSKPKCVSLSLDNFLAAAKSAIEVCDYIAGDTWLLSLPLYHVGGLSIIFRSLLAKARFVTDPVIPFITHLSYVPTQLQRSSPIYPLLKTILLSGAPIHHIPDRLPIIAAYGMTETASMVLGKSLPTKKNGHYYLGFPHAGKEVKIEDGELFVRADSLFQGYWNGDLLEKPQDWFATKDLAHFNPEYGYAIVGRKDNQFISGGENIQPEEIESAIQKHPDILDAFVVPVWDIEFGARPVAFVRTHKSLDQEALKTFLFSVLPKYKIPIKFFLLEESENLKISRNTLIQKANNLNIRLS